MSTTRRSFLRNLAAAVLLSPVISRLCEDPELVFEVQPQQTATVNPDYENAAYEASVLIRKDVLTQEMLDKFYRELRQIGGRPV